MELEIFVVEESASLAAAMHETNELEFLEHTQILASELAHPPILASQTVFHLLVRQTVDTHDLRAVLASPPLEAHNVFAVEAN